jgi:hypothetical protein
VDGATNLEAVIARTGIKQEINKKTQKYSYFGSIDIIVI